MNEIKRMCQSGIFEDFKKVCDEIITEYDVEYNENPYTLAYNHGKKEGAIHFKQRLYDKIDQLAKD